MNNDWLDINVLEDYLDGKLDAKAMHFVERQALEDPFVAEALDGLLQSPKRKQTLSLLQKQLHERIAYEPVKRKMWGLTTHRLSIAATAAVVFISVSILFYMREVNRRNDIAKHKAKGVILNLDTASALANTKSVLPDSLKTGADEKPDLIDKAIENAKQTDLALNTKKIEEAKANQQRAYENRSKKEIATTSQLAIAKPGIINEALSQSAPLNTETKVAAPQTKITIRGQIISQSDGQPLPGVHIKAMGDNSSAVSDAKGNFALVADSTKARNLSIAYIGYQNTIAAIDPKSNSKIALKEDTQSLNEVVIVNYGSDKYKNEAPKKKNLGSINNSANQQISSGNKIVYNGNIVTQKGTPVVGATVKIAGSTAQTDTNGYFSVPIDSNSKNKELLINAKGFNDVSITGLQDPNALRIALSGNKSINEIAMLTGSNGQKKENISASKISLRAKENLDGKPVAEITKPIPVSTVDYNQYLENNNKLYNSKGPAKYVTVSFTVNKNGRPSKVKVIKSLNKQADAEARRLVENGPDWVLPKTGTNQAELSIKF